MNEALVHRGPDGEGNFRTPHLALAMRRLSIIDPLTGWQPLHNEDKSITLIANGEIYNFIELRQQLRDRGHSFHTGSDCEVIAHLYEEYDEACVHHLRGMFAFALWDARRGRLLLARDRLGEKPLYVHHRDGQVAFASELRPLLRAGVVDFELDARSLYLYFHYQYVPEPWTPIQGVKKLPAGHLLTITVDPWTIQERCYWRMEDAPPVDGDPARRIRSELESVCELIIRSDVPVGVALSGGLDSSAIAVLASRNYPGMMHAFTAGYSGRPHSDERADAKALATHLGMPFHEVVIDYREMVREFPELVYRRDDPIADISGYGYYAVARAARQQGVRVLLQGQGGDELFWGYDWVREAVSQSLRKSRLDSRPPKLSAYLRLSRPRSGYRRALLEWVASLAGARSSWTAFRRDCLSPRERLVFYDLTPDFQAASRQIRRICQESWLEPLNDSEAFDVFRMPLPWPPLETLLTRLICQTYLLENGIAQGDRLSMASSVELRLPLVDYRLVETVVGLRRSRSDVALAPKTWFKEAIRDIVPDWVIRRPKRGFQPPVRAWHSALFTEYGRLLEDGTLVQSGILKPEAAIQLARGPFAWDAIVPLSFKALVLEIWCRQCLSNVLSGAK